MNKIYKRFVLMVCIVLMISLVGYKLFDYKKLKGEKQQSAQSDNVNKLYKRFLFNDKKTMERYNNIYNIAIKYLENSLEENN